MLLFRCFLLLSLACVSAAESSPKGGLWARVNDKLTKTTESVAESVTEIARQPIKNNEYFQGKVQALANPKLKSTTAGAEVTASAAMTPPKGGLWARVNDKLTKTTESVAESVTEIARQSIKNNEYFQGTVQALVNPKLKSTTARAKVTNVLPVVAVAIALTAGGIAWTKTKDDKDELNLARKFLENSAQPQKKDK